MVKKGAHIVGPCSGLFRTARGPTAKDNPEKGFKKFMLDKFFAPDWNQKKKFCTVNSIFFLVPV